MRPGWKTTEFWLTVGGNVLLTLGTVLHFVPGPIAAGAAAAIGAAYSIGRAMTKSNAPGPDLSGAIRDVGQTIVGALAPPSSAELGGPGATPASKI